MQKIDSLREKFVTAYPEFARDPDRLRMWIEEGHLRSHTQAGNLNFSLEYTLVVVIEGWTRSHLLIWIQLIDWLRIHQPDLLAVGNSKTSLPFEFEPLSNKSSNISFELALNEAVRAALRDDGGYDMQYASEQSPLFSSAAPITQGAGDLTSIWMDGQQLVPDPFY